jgi:ribosomal protein S21
MAGKVIHAEVKPKYPDEPIERMIKRLGKKVKKSKIMETIYEKRYYEKPSVKKAKARKRRKKILEKLHKLKQPRPDR